ncbi:MAG TPA: hypothetical protein VIL55_14910, partial [Naasia sp.]
MIVNSRGAPGRDFPVNGLTSSNSVTQPQTLQGFAPARDRESVAAAQLDEQDAGRDGDDSETHQPGQ